MDPIDPLLLDPDYLDALYREYVRDPGAVDDSWAQFFESFDRFDTTSRNRVPIFLSDGGAVPDHVPADKVDAGIQIYDLVHTYRQFGHLGARLDPLGRNIEAPRSLDLSQFGFSEADLDTVVTCAGFHGLDSGTVREYRDVLRETYCGPIGVEYMDVLDTEKREWLQHRMEPRRNRARLTNQEKKKLLHALIRADQFEESLGLMYTGAKRFSLEGGTTLITLLQTLIEDCAEDDVNQAIIGMAHRGRLNVLAQVLQKPLEYILAEFEGRPLSSVIQGYGDVKYHMGYSSDYTHNNGNVLHLSMAFNPSHLETINPVVEGIARAKQDRGDRTESRRVVPILIHGDAAFAGQGVVAETLLLSGLNGYGTGGTVHIICNNQIGFTAEPHESRPTRYASDLAKGIRAPVFHVNADHPEAVYLVAQHALAFRQRFGLDVVIDLICFRRHGHNELDDATFTQPMMAKLIKDHQPVATIYGDKLTLAGVVSKSETDDMAAAYKTKMKSSREVAKSLPEQVTQRLGGAWTGLRAAGSDWSANTAVPRPTLDKIARALTRAPDGFHWHKRLQRIVGQRADAVREDKPFDWGTAEALAFGSLLVEGTAVRLSGQDSGRGTFSHRHSIYTDQQTGQRYVPLNYIESDQAQFAVYNSPLSEYAVLGFEYGYSSADPWTLVVWEAQFGDFANGAQVVIDQLIASGEYKWGRMSGLVMLLPHGYEGQGPEHSSARLERFLALCAENNMQVVNLTTPAQFFHCLRRQMKRDFRKPLVVMSPKSLLRHKQAVSTAADLSTGGFHNVLDDPTMSSPEDRDQVTRVLLCSGKVFYALSAARAHRERRDIAIVRLEQLYPYPLGEVRRTLSSYRNAERLVWVQEEPRNMGAWRNLRHRFEASVPEGAVLDYVGRDSRAVPATGSVGVHRDEEQQIVDAAFGEQSAGDRVVKRNGSGTDSGADRRDSDGDSGEDKRPTDGAATAAGR